jgi:hypothetical protein
MLSAILVRLARPVQVAHGEVLGFHFRPQGFNLGTDLHGLETPGMKAAAGGGIDRAGNVALQDDPFLFLVGVQDRHRGHECLGVGVERLGEEFLVGG